MSIRYVAVQWNRSRCLYDAALLAGIVLYVATYLVAGGFDWSRAVTPANKLLMIGALGTCALVLLHVALCIGPLARMSPRFLPLLSNRRHLGVVTFLVAVTHAVAAVGYYHGFRRRNPLISLLATNVNYGSWIGFPFEVLGLAALAVLFLMAATSHNFWQKNLTPGVWKALHMLVYPAYALLVMHVTLGALQRTISLLPAVVLAVGASLVVALHLVAGVRERWRDLQGFRIGADVRGLPWLDVGCVDDIPNNRGKVVCVSGQERIAVFRYDSKVSAVTNVCAHQQGPLGEGVIQGGCITCPWHGWEYTPQDGRSPPPYTEKISTYPVRVENGRILIYPEALPPGTFTEPAHVDD